MLNEKIRNLRKQNNMTQEELAEKLNVSRQAITKWESGAGQPDIGNLKAIAALFGISLDELLSDSELSNQDNLSRTEFDVFETDDFQLDCGCVKELDVSLGDFEKIMVEVRTDLPDKAYHLAKVKLENGRKASVAEAKIILDKNYNCIGTQKPLSKQEAQQHLSVKLLLPLDLCGNIELIGDADTLILHDFDVEKHIEFDGKARTAKLSRMNGHLELTSGCDMDVCYDGSMKQLDINQLGAVSNLILTDNARVNVYSKSRSCHVVFDGVENTPDAENGVELNGRKTELTVRRG